MLVSKVGSSRSQVGRCPEGDNVHTTSTEFRNRQAQVMAVTGSIVHNFRLNSFSKKNSKRVDILNYLVASHTRMRINSI